MSEEVIAILLSLLTYAMCVLMPIVPALIIYKKAPDSKLLVTGPLSKLTVRATGAIGAYIVFFILSEFIVLNIMKRIDATLNPTWLVQAKVELQDADGTPITDATALSTLQVYISPDLHSVNGSFTVIKIPGSLSDRWPHPFITFRADNYMNETIDLCRYIREGKVRMERSENFLELTEAIKLKRKPSTQYAPPAAPLMSEGATGPPVAIPEGP